MAQEIIPDKQSVLTCLKQKVYYVDFYQREYVWTKNTVEVLLSDIFYAFEISYKEHKDVMIRTGSIRSSFWIIKLPMILMLIH